MKNLFVDRIWPVGLSVLSPKQQERGRGKKEAERERVQNLGINPTYFTTVTFLVHSS